MAFTWEQLELPALRWVHTAPHDETGAVGTGDMHRTEDAAAALPQLTQLQLDEALRRLEQHGLIDGHRGETSDLVYWMDLRVTADGLRVLGEWPPVAGASVNDALVAVLRYLAPHLPEEDASAARRAGSAIAKMSTGAVLDVIKDEVKRLGEEAGR